MNTTFYLALGKVSQQSVNGLKESFNSLPKNPEHKDGSYRLRRFSAFHLKDGCVHKLPSRSFNQSGELNKFQGDVERKFDDITENCYGSQSFAEIMKTYANESGLPDETDIEVHQIRVCSDPGKTVELAPEGVHQDGFNRIGMFIVNCENITGGNLKVYKTKDSAAIIDNDFSAGEYMVLNDELFWHYGDPVTANDNDKKGFYDLFVFTGIHPQG